MNETENSIAQTERIGRYLFQKARFVSTKRRVKYGAFLPNYNGQTSVIRITGLTENQIWNIGQNVVARRNNRNLKARADIFDSQVADEDLLIEPDTNSHKLHANIIGWPEKQSEQRLVAQKLADKAKLQLVPS